MDNQLLTCGTRLLGNRATKPRTLFSEKSVCRRFDSFWLRLELRKVSLHVLSCIHVCMCLQAFVTCLLQQTGGRFRVHVTRKCEFVVSDRRCTCIHTGQWTSDFGLPRIRSHVVVMHDVKHDQHVSHGVFIFILHQAISWKGNLRQSTSSLAGRQNICILMCVSLS